MTLFPAGTHIVRPREAPRPIPFPSRSRLGRLAGRRLTAVGGVADQDLVDRVVVHHHRDALRVVGGKGACRPRLSRGR